MDLGNTPSWVCDLTDMTGPYCLRCDLRGDSAVLETAGSTLLTGCKWVMSFSAVAEGTAAQRSHQIKRVHVSDCLRVSSSRESCPFPRASVFIKVSWGESDRNLSQFIRKHLPLLLNAHMQCFFLEIQQFFFFNLFRGHSSFRSVIIGKATVSVTKGFVRLFVKSLLSRGCVTSMLVDCTVIIVAWHCNKKCIWAMTLALVVNDVFYTCHIWQK